MNSKWTWTGCVTAALVLVAGQGGLAREIPGQNRSSHADAFGLHDREYTSKTPSLRSRSAVRLQSVSQSVAVAGEAPNSTGKVAGTSAGEKTAFFGWGCPLGCNSGCNACTPCRPACYPRPACAPVNYGCQPVYGPAYGGYGLGAPCGGSFGCGACGTCGPVGGCQPVGGCGPVGVGGYYSGPVIGTPSVGGSYYGRPAYYGTGYGYPVYGQSSDDQSTPRTRTAPVSRSRTLVHDVRGNPFAE